MRNPPVNALHFPLKGKKRAGAAARAGTGIARGARARNGNGSGVMTVKRRGGAAGARSAGAVAARNAGAAALEAGSEEADTELHCKCERLVSSPVSPIPLSP